MDSETSSEPVKIPTPHEYLKWSDYEYDHSDKTPDWFWVVGIVGLVAIIGAMIFKNFLFAIILLIGTLTIMLFGARKPEFIEFEINKRGIKVKNDLYPFATIKSFALKDEEGPYKLMIESDRLILPHIIIPLGDTNPEDIRKILNRFLPEEPFHESLVDKLSEHLGF